MAVRIDGVWHLSPSEYKELRDDSQFLRNLRDAGVDNWEGYHYGWAGYDEEED